MPAPTTTSIFTPRLELRLLGPAVITACLQGDLAQAASLTGMTLPAEMLSHSSSLRFDLAQHERGPDYTPWATRAIIHQASGTVVGMIRFHTCPNPPYLQPMAPDAVELGYRIFSDYRRQGFAEEALQGMLQWAAGTQNIHHFILSISPNNHASLQLAAKQGFHKISEVMDEADGPEWVFFKHI